MRRITRLLVKGGKVTRQNDGFTLLEMLVVVSITSTLLAVGWTQLRPSSARLAANALQAQVQQARIEAIKRNRPVAVLWASQTQSFTTLVKADEDSTTLPCSASDRVVLRQVISEFPRVQAANVFTYSGSTSAIVWYPNGLPRFCDGSALPTTSSTVRLQDERATLYVRVAPAGRVEVSGAP